MAVCGTVSPPILRSRTILIHAHYMQSETSPGKQLLQWVSNYIYAVEEGFADETHARAVAAFFCDALLRNGMTTACV